MRALLLVALAGCLTGCSSASSLFEPPLHFTVDAAFGSDVPFQTAADRWNLYLAKDKRIELDQSGEWRVLREDPNTGYNGGTSNDERIIRIRPSADPYLTVIHEFGHAAGLHHTAHGVMDPEHATDVFSDEDLDECRRVGACP